MAAAMFMAIASNAQNNDLLYQFMGKYHMMDSSELLQPKLPNKAFTTTAPPTGSIRAIAEWEPAQSVLISYSGGFGIPYSLIAQLSNNCNLITLVNSTSQQTTVTNYYNSNGVNMANCSFKVATIDSYWTRDYGPWFIMNNNSTIAIVDFPYNRPSRPNDDNVPVVMATYLAEPLYGMNVFHTGGNYMCDGMGVAAMTDLVLDPLENTLTDAQVDTLFKQYMGITKNYITADPLADYIKHIDCWGKFLDVDKILIASVPITNSHYNDYEAMATYWANETSSYGNHYQVYRTYEPSDEPYSNSLILNKSVYVPIMGGTHATADNNALAVYQHAMPGYNVYGVIGLTGSNSWVSTDALHCRTHEIADKGMLYIKHYPLLGLKPMQTQYTVSADIYALSTSSIITDSVYVKYRVNHASWIKIAMTHGTGNTWTTNIPQQVGGDTVEYYIHASDQSPRNQTHPLIGAPDPHKFWITTTTAIAQNENETKAVVFPNPANSSLFVQMKNANESLTINIIDLLGNQIKTMTVNNDFENMICIPLTDLPSGTYFVQIRSGSFVNTKKVMVIH